MKKILQFLSITMIAWVCIGVSAKLPSHLATATQPTLAPILKRVMPTVVNISVRGKLPPMALLQQQQAQQRLEQQQQPGGTPSPRPRRRDPRMLPLNPKFEDLGSGVIIDAKKGYIVTNAHVIENAETITVTLDDGRRLKAKIIGKDVPSDVAVLKIQPGRLTSITFGNSTNLKVGDYVVAIGNPFGLQQSVTSGIISGLQRNVIGLDQFENFIQTDAPINPGNSGGALINLRGELIGINTALLAPTGANIGIGFAIPSNMVKGVADQLIKYGKVKRGMLGVIVQSFTPALAKAFNIPTEQGALVIQVEPGSPGAKVGIKPKDVITSINNQPVKDAIQVRTIIGLLRVGTKVNVQIQRGKKTLQLNSVVGKSEKESKQDKHEKTSLLGNLTLTEVNQIAPGLGLIKGIGVLDVPDTSAAWRGGLRKGDIIVGLNNQPVYSLPQWTELSQDVKDQTVLLQILRGARQPMYLAIEK